MRSILALRRGDDDDFGAGAGFDPPENEAGERPILAGAVASDDGEAALFGCEAHHFGLLGVGVAGVGECVGDEGDGVVAESGEFFAHGDATRSAAAFARLGAGGVVAFGRLGAAMEEVAE